MTLLLDQPQTLPDERRFSLDEYYQLAELEFFRDQRVELFDGRIVSMPPQGNAHDIAVTVIRHLFERLLGDQFWVRSDMSINFAPRSAPEPDIAIVAGRAVDSVAKPKSALLVIEVSQTTLKYDQGAKALLYASNAIEDYWVVNLVDRQLTVHRTPLPLADGPFTHRYADVKHFTLDASVTPLAFQSHSVPVAELFPPIIDAR